MQVSILSRKDLEAILEMPKVIEGVKATYRAKAGGQVVAWPLVEHHFDNEGIMDIRSGGVFGEVGAHGAKLLNNFPRNAEKGLTVFTGVLMTFDSETGLPMGVMDASYITSMRTGAAAAIGAKVLARKDSETLLLVGAGRQSIYLLGATLLEMPQLKRVLVADPMGIALAEAYVKDIKIRLQEELQIETDVTFAAAADLQTAVGEADVVLTVTRSTEPLIQKDWVKPGTHFSCIGADMVGKEELDPALFRVAKAFTDDTTQCLTVGELEIPAKLGIVTAETVCGEIGQVMTGAVSGRTSEEDITIFDATGLAALDLVTAKTAVLTAREKGMGQTAEI
ncbi:ornithine cyclodeaminase family protein [Ihubacter sp. mB4P-1]|uniref:ornithine cyclodeaminase family protein n=1 Tax=Ihubacter sp. mB4P-1 TaxID=3242370 RepID=UPI003C7E6544